MRLPAISPLGKSPSMAVGVSRGVFVCGVSVFTCCARANGLANSGTSANAKLLTFIVTFSLAPSLISVSSTVSDSGATLFALTSASPFCSALFSSAAGSSLLLRLSISPAERSLVESSPVERS